MTTLTVNAPVETIHESEQTDDAWRCEYKDCYNTAEWLVKNYCDCPWWLRCNDCLKRMLRASTTRWEKALADGVDGTVVFWRCNTCKAVRKPQHPSIQVRPIH